MTAEYHRDLLVEAHADGAELRELREQLQVLHAALAHAAMDDFNGLRREFDALHEDFEGLHNQDMSGTVDKDAHSAWRARLRSLRARAVALGEHA